MPSDYRLQLKTARQAAGLTQEEAAEAANVSIESWRAYEGGNRLPPPETAAIIADALGADWLKIVFAVEALDALDLLDADVIPKDLTAASVSIANRVSDFVERRRGRQLLSIAEDGVVDAAEEPLFDAIRHDLDGLAVAALVAKFPQKKRAPTLARRSSGVRTSQKGANDCRTMIAHREEESNRNLAARGGASR